MSEGRRDKLTSEQRQIDETHRMYDFFLAEIELFAEQEFSTPHHSAWMSKAALGLQDRLAVSVLESRG